ncbi:MAG TPA: hypothetical protein VFP74_04505 [Pseudolabrys sp.]|jgi:hypothetical protein|nr:hypothetical protein [Pseudolabrys sp.]
MNIPSPKKVLETWSALIGISGATYLELLEELDLELTAAADSLQWPLLIVGAAGTGSILFSSWRQNRRERPLAPRK